MKKTDKQRLLNFLQNGGSYDERMSLVKMLEDETQYVDIPFMCISQEDVCKQLPNASDDDLEKIANVMADYFQENDFHETLMLALENFE